MSVKALSYIITIAPTTKHNPKTPTLATNLTFGISGPGAAAPVNAGGLDFCVCPEVVLLGVKELVALCDDAAGCGVTFCDGTGTGGGGCCCEGGEGVGRTGGVVIFCAGDGTEGGGCCGCGCGVGVGSTGNGRTVPSAGYPMDELSIPDGAITGGIKVDIGVGIGMVVTPGFVASPFPYPYAADELCIVVFTEVI
jgi:hypothetical protein